MSIKSKDTEVFYLSCIMCNELNGLIDVIKSQKISVEEISNSSLFEKIIELKERLVYKINETNG